LRKSNHSAKSRIALARKVAHQVERGDMQVRFEHEENLERALNAEESLEAIR
jgi:hypothetical protein